MAAAVRYPPHAVRGATPPAPVPAQTLSRSERAELARNDAAEDVQGQGPPDPPARDQEPE